MRYWKKGWMDGWLNEWLDGWMDGWTNECTNEQMHKWKMNKWKRQTTEWAMEESQHQHNDASRAVSWHVKHRNTMIDQAYILYVLYNSFFACMPKQVSSLQQCGMLQQHCFCCVCLPLGCWRPDNVVDSSSAALSVSGLRFLSEYIFLGFFTYT